MGSPPAGAPRFVALLQAARGGSREALGELLDSCRNYLLAVAMENMRPGLAGKVGSSDIVHDTFVEALGAFGQFRGACEDEFLAWLRTALLNRLANVHKAWETHMRSVNQEIPCSPDSSRHIPLCELPAGGPSPSEELVSLEQGKALDQAFEQLSADHQQAIRLRIDEDLSFENVGQRLGRSAEAAKKLYVRAIRELARIMNSPQAGSNATGQSGSN